LSHVCDRLTNERIVRCSRIIGRLSSLTESIDYDATLHYMCASNIRLGSVLLHVKYSALIRSRGSSNRIQADSKICLSVYISTVTFYTSVRFNNDWVQTVKSAVE
jgi:hypothetical protein